MFASVDHELDPAAQVAQDRLAPIGFDVHVALEAADGRGATIRFHDEP